MPIAVTCFCGTSFAVPEQKAETRQPCPACGRMVDVPGRPPGLTEEEKSSLPVCPDCQGDGKCRHCGGLRGRARPERGSGSLLWSAVWPFLNFWLTLYWMLAPQDVSSKHCTGCNGNGRCFKCRGFGRLRETGGESCRPSG